MELAYRLRYHLKRADLWEVLQKDCIPLRDRAAVLMRTGRGVSPEEVLQRPEMTGMYRQVFWTEGDKRELSKLWLVALFYTV